MQRRREHLECESRPGLGCLVYGTRICAHRRSLAARLKRLVTPNSQQEWTYGWLFFAMLPVIFWLVRTLTVSMLAVRLVA
jgi:hypothetical protein